MNDSGTDFFKIQSLYSKYCFALDGNDPQLLVECFAPDGIFQVSERQFTGADQLAAVAKAGENRPRHNYTNLWVKSIDGDKAVASAYFFLINVADGATCGYGIYDDDMTRDEHGVWRFQHRRVNFLWQSEAYKARTTAIKKQ
jgi:SnoaL-like domain